MTLPASPPITLGEIKTEFAGPGNLLSYYRGGSYVPNTANNTSIPTSGVITMKQFLGTSNVFTPVQHTYSNGVSGITETIPAGASNVTIEVWGATSGGMAFAAGSGSYSRSVYSVVGDGGKTMSVSTGIGGIGGAGGSANATGTTSVTSGTFSITTMTVNFGVRGTNSGPGAGGAATTGGNVVNTAGNPGASSGASGGAAVTGVHASGNPGGNQEADGGNGVISFYYQ